MFRCFAQTCAGMSANEHDVFDTEVTQDEPDVGGGERILSRLGNNVLAVANAETFCRSRGRRGNMVRPRLRLAAGLVEKLLPHLRIEIHTVIEEMAPVDKYHRHSHLAARIGNLARVRFRHVEQIIRRSIAIFQREPHLFP